MDYKEGITKDQFLEVIKNTLPHNIKDTGTNFKLIVEVLFKYIYFMYKNFDDILNVDDVENSSGIHLDRVGSNLGISRDTGETDDEYRFRILLFASLRVKNSSIPAIYEAIKSSTGKQDGDFRLVENPNDSPASFAYVPTLTDEKDNKLVELLQRVKPAGVKVVRSMYNMWIWQDAKDYGTWGDIKDNFHTW